MKKNKMKLLNVEVHLPCSNAGGEFLVAVTANMVYIRALHLQALSLLAEAFRISCNVLLQFT